MTLVECSGEGVVGKMPYTNLMVKYYFNCFGDYISRDVPCFCVLLSVEKTVPSEKEKMSFSLLDIVTTVPESVKLIWIHKIQDLYDHLEYWLLS